MPLTFAKGLSPARGYAKNQGLANRRVAQKIELAGSSGQEISTEGVDTQAGDKWHWIGTAENRGSILRTKRSLNDKNCQWVVLSCTVDLEKILSVLERRTCLDEQVKMKPRSMELQSGKSHFLRPVHQDSSDDVTSLDLGRVHGLPTLEANAAGNRLVMTNLFKWVVK